MEHLRKKEWIKIDSIWRRTFLVEVKEETGYYTKAADGRADWVVLAWVKNDVWWDLEAKSRYDSQPVPEELFIWTDEWHAVLLKEKPSIESLWEYLSDAVYLAAFTPDVSWTFILTHEDHPCRYIFSEKRIPDSMH